MKKITKILPDVLLLMGLVAIVSAVHELCPPLALLLSGIFAVCFAFILSV